MRKRFKRLFENLAYAGLKPRGRRAPQTPAPNANAPKPNIFAAMQAWVDSKISGSGPADPLYLSNRTMGQKLKTWATIGVPLTFVLGGVGLVLLGYFDAQKPVAPPPGGLSNAEIAAQMLPNLNKDLHIESQHDLDVEDVHIVNGSPARLAGVAKNNTDHAIAKAELIFDLTDRTGSRQGAVSTEIQNIASKSSVPFQFAIEQSSAFFALVREVRVQ